MELDLSAHATHANAPRLLDQLVDLTGILDLELLEFSLLKTIYGFLQPRALALVRLNARGQPLMEIVYGDGRCTVTRENVELKDGLRRADRFITATSAPEMLIRDDAGLLQIVGLMTSSTSRSYLQIRLDKEISKFDAHLMSGLLQVYRNFCSLLVHSQTDQLTGLANRRTFDACVAKVHELLPAPAEPVPVERREPTSMRYWLTMVDIDHFKSINDRFGHLYGDEVLVLLARLMTETFRVDDMVFRFGGEEFVLILRCPDIEHARQALERFRTLVSETHFPQIGQVTISLGAVEMTREVFAATLLDQADQALYFSKGNGRNQANFYEDLVARGVAHEVEVKAGDISFF
jgi:diguanylate cyclase (GGDEF)-like protein